MELFKYSPYYTMNFNDYKYERIDIDAVKKQFEELIDSFKKADNAEKQYEIMDKVINGLFYLTFISILIISMYYYILFNIY